MRTETEDKVEETCRRTGREDRKRIGEAGQYKDLG
jgi:hypothetical protein